MANTASVAANTDRAGVMPTDQTQRGSASQQSEAQKEPQRSEVEQAAKELARRAETMGRDLRFEVDDDSGMTVVKVIDRTTEEVVRQIPSEEAVQRASDTTDDSLALIDDRA